MSRGPRKYVTKLQKLLPVVTEAAFSFSCLCKPQTWGDLPPMLLSL